jgi:hypothetical protein
MLTGNYVVVVKLLHLEQNVDSSLRCWHHMEVSCIAGVSEDHNAPSVDGVSTEKRININNESL